MSTLVMDTRPVGRVEQGKRAGIAAHPRGAGFRVLSRIARVQADEAAYTPRHRRELPAELQLRHSVAV
jgi:hypothetical protein